MKFETTGLRLIGCSTVLVTTSSVQLFFYYILLCNEMEEFLYIFSDGLLSGESQGRPEGCSVGIIIVYYYYFLEFFFFFWTLRVPRTKKKVWRPSAVCSITADRIHNIPMPKTPIYYCYWTAEHGMSGIKHDVTMCSHTARSVQPALVYL